MNIIISNFELGTVAVWRSRGMWREDMIQQICLMSVKTRDLNVYR